MDSTAIEVSPKFLVRLSVCGLRSSSEQESDTFKGQRHLTKVVLYVLAGHPGPPFQQ